jgi:hypothetical protein
MIFHCDDTDQWVVQLMAQMDKYTNLIMTVVPSVLAPKKESGPSDDDVKTDEEEVGWTKIGNGFHDWERVSVPTVSIRASKQTYEILKVDDYFGDYTFMDEVKGYVIGGEYSFPLEDKIRFPAEFEMENIMEQTVLKKALPNSYTDKFDMLSDESFSRMFFYGIGAVLLVKQEQASSSQFGPFEVDMPLQDLPTRDGFRPLGARIHFDENQVVTAILDHANDKLYTPGKDGWEAAKFLARSSALTLITVQEHLVWTHLILSNSMTKFKILELPPSHPIRRLLTIFTFGTNEVNSAAQDMLLPEFSMLHRAAGFTYDAMEKIFDISYEGSNVFEPFPDRPVNEELVELSENNKFPFLSEGIAYYEIVKELVVQWMSNAEEAGTDSYAVAFYNAMRKSSLGQKYTLPIYSEGTMIDLLTQCIFTVTAHHELVGYLVDYTDDASHAAFRVSDQDGTRNDLQSYLLTNIIAASTSIRMPKLMADFQFFFGYPEGQAPAWERTVWDSFVAMLGDQSIVVQADDQQRIARNPQHQFPYFDPNRLECSVSV